MLFQENPSPSFLCVCKRGKLLSSMYRKGRKNFSQLAPPLVDGFFSKIIKTRRVSRWNIKTENEQKYVASDGRVEMGAESRHDNSIQSSSGCRIWVVEIQAYKHLNGTTIRTSTQLIMTECYHVSFQNFPLFGAWLELTKSKRERTLNVNYWFIIGNIRERITLRIITQSAIHCQSDLHKNALNILCQYFQSHCSSFAFFYCDTAKKNFHLISFFAVFVAV